MATSALLIKPLHPELGKSWPLPQAHTALAAGFDLVAAIDAPCAIPPHEHLLVPCGFAMALEPGFEAQVRPRSGLALRHRVTLLNSPGTIDADYRGEVCAILINHGDAPFVVEPGARIAQLVVAKVAPVMMTVVSSLPDSKRGEAGFGSTGT